jgi:hypothetical protein
MKGRRGKRGKDWRTDGEGEVEAVTTGGDWRGGQEGRMKVFNDLILKRGKQIKWDETRTGRERKRRTKRIQGDNKTSGGGVYARKKESPELEHRAWGEIGWRMRGEDEMRGRELWTEERIGKEDNIIVQEKTEN